MGGVFNGGGGGGGADYDIGSNNAFQHLLQVYFIFSKINKNTQFLNGNY